GWRGAPLHARWIRHDDVGYAVPISRLDTDVDRRERHSQGGLSAAYLLLAQEERWRRGCGCGFRTSDADRCLCRRPVQYVELDESRHAREVIVRGRSTCGRTRDAGSPARARRWVSADHLGDPVPCPLRHPDPAGEWEEISGDHVDSRRRDDGRRRRVVAAREALAPPPPAGAPPRSDAARLSRKVDDGDATGSSTSVDPQELPRGVRSIL